MLETVKAYIKTMPNISFSQYYVQYICEVQDNNIEAEMEFLISHNELTPMRMNKLLQKSYEGLVKISGRDK